jgi:hypothetical protein
VRPAALKIAAALSYSGLSRSGLYRAAARGEIELRKLGRSTLVLTESLDRFLAGLPAPVLRPLPPTVKPGASQRGR